MCADVGCQIGFALRVPIDQERCAGLGRDEHSVGAVSALWLSSHSRLSRTSGPSNEHRSRLAVVAKGRTPSSSETFAETRCAGAPRPQAPLAAGQVWAYDFVFDACANGQPLKCLTVIDEFSRECLAIDVAGSIRSGRVIEVLAQLISLHGAPKILRSDKGPEFVSKALLKWANSQNLDIALIDPGKPWQNGTTESFNGKFRDECLSMEWFGNRVEANALIDQWRQHYNYIRPHSSLGNQTPMAFKKWCLSTTKPEAVFQE